MAKSCTIEPVAFYKLLLHSLKHPGVPVNGVLLGTVTPLAGGSALVRVADAVPVGHGFLTLAPLLETALSQIEGYLHEQAGRLNPLSMRIVGYYQCNERLGDLELGPGRRAADRIEAAFPNSVALVLDSGTLDTALQAAAAHPKELQFDEESVLWLFVKDGARGWIRASASGGKTSLCCPAQDIAAQVVKYVNEGRHTALADFEQHMDNIHADWLNPQLLTASMMLSELT